jgi:hypothetical protein
LGCLGLFFMFLHCGFSNMLGVYRLKKWLFWVLDKCSAYPNLFTYYEQDMIKFVFFDY